MFDGKIPCHSALKRTVPKYAEQPLFNEFDNNSPGCIAFLTRFWYNLKDLKPFQVCNVCNSVTV